MTPVWFRIPGVYGGSRQRGSGVCLLRPRFDPSTGLCLGGKRRTRTSLRTRTVFRAPGLLPARPRPSRPVIVGADAHLSAPNHMPGGWPGATPHGLAPAPRAIPDLRRDSNPRAPSPTGPGCSSTELRRSFLGARRGSRTPARTVSRTSNPVTSGWPTSLGVCNRLGHTTVGIVRTCTRTLITLGPTTRLTAARPPDHRAVDYTNRSTRCGGAHGIRTRISDLARIPHDRCAKAPNAFLSAVERYSCGPLWASKPTRVFGPRIATRDRARSRTVVGKGATAAPIDAASRRCSAG